MKRKSNHFTQLLFFVYLLLLIWIILFKLQFSMEALDRGRALNLIPFHYGKGIGGAYHFKEMLDNVLIFMPMGIYLQMLFPKSKFQTKLLMIAGTSLCLEIAQYVLAVGRTDITDLITNTVGGFLGLVLYGIVNRLLKDRAKTDKLFFVIAVVVSVLFVGLLAVLLLTNQ